MVANFYETEFSNLDRRKRRNSQIKEYEEKHNI
jgi:ribose 5-phosphate isomerase RpiB